VPEEGDTAVAEWMATALRRPPVVGDRVTLDSATLIVRELDGSRIVGVGLSLKA
jgi:NhaP-type Na+/H+ and K+/H+ antiporter